MSIINEGDPKISFILCLDIETVVFGGLLANLIWPDGIYTLLAVCLGEHFVPKIVIVHHIWEWRLQFKILQFHDKELA